ncbi:trifunctional hydroxymethylpyrimidine kinase/phosphomethylpyrimidine kinase/thiaminase [Malassezia equina]|uniref:Trifunctional hydroxymethylpyrimidine kinase/phosphomethylpyrimidine kinase/thiaminase n=1 Tax=Malassezia equina TaxID=1381935 RepID=A0AAF0IXZ5_9BASI|nr:trifunctional hydroxymethylpyrimidine kinase/phosphomethylpyrimidine kinase/thiaminase [Malassezia equina]
MRIPQVLTIAGSDSGGGAGIQADLKTFTAFTTFGMSVITALTAQNTQGVSAIHTPPAEFVEQQFRCLVQDIRIDAMKVGMLSNAENVHVVSECVKEWRKTNDGDVVLDPVMMSSTGSTLLEEEAIERVLRELLPLSSIVTPNLFEAEQILYRAQILDMEASTLHGRARMAQALTGLGAENALVKGGHAPYSTSTLEQQLKELGFSLVTEECDSVATACHREQNAAALLSDEKTAIEELGSLLGVSVYTRDSCYLVLCRSASDYLFMQSPQYSWNVDVLYESHRQRTTFFVLPYVSTTATHGTGCTLSAAICAASAQGLPLRAAILKALLYMQQALATSLPNLGHGTGSLDHASCVVTRGVPQRTEHAPYPLITRLASRAWNLWHTYTRHPFVVQMMRGQLPFDSLVWFLRQDYLYLRHYSRVWSKAGANPECTAYDMAKFSAMANAFAKETQVHVQVCESLGICGEELELTKESRATMAYSRFMLDACEGGLLSLLISLASCAFGYAEVGLWAKRHQLPNIAAPYQRWIDEYSGDDYQSMTHDMLEYLEAHVERVMPSIEQVDQLQTIWETATRLEVGMWDEALAMGQTT